MTIVEQKERIKKEHRRIKIAGMKKNGCYISNLTRNDFVFWFSTKKEMVGNEKKKLFFMKGDFFKNVKEYIIPRRCLVTIRTLRFTLTV